MKAISEQLRDISNMLMNAETYPCTDSEESCIRKEEKRPLTSQEKRLGWSMRPYSAYTSDNMCLSCRVYWHVTQATNDMHKLEMLDR